jgi:coenzyme F420-dependent glucose-6-phosphate dehydrogenase
MVKIGYMSDLSVEASEKSLEHAILAEKVGFQMIAAADHFYPWIHTGRSCTFAWVWLSVVASRTSSVPVGTAVTAPILRYNPAVIAQAFGTLGELFPSRVFLGLGAGEAVNEVPVGYDWPSAGERVKRLEEALAIIRSLLTEKSTTYEGQYFRVKDARLYSRPRAPVPLILAASRRRTAELAGRYADGIMTAPQLFGPEIMRHFETAAAKAGRDPSRLEKHLNFGVSFDRDYEKALSSCRPFGATILPFIFEYGISDPREIERYSRYVDERELAKHWVVTTNPEDCIRTVESYARLGITHFHIQSASPDEEDFVRMMGEKVVPYFLG